MECSASIILWLSAAPIAMSVALCIIVYVVCRLAEGVSKLNAAPSISEYRYMTRPEQAQEKEVSHPTEPPSDGTLDSEQLQKISL